MNGCGFMSVDVPSITRFESIDKTAQRSNGALILIVFNCIIRLQSLQQIVRGRLALPKIKFNNSCGKIGVKAF